MPIRDCHIGTDTRIVEPVNLYECSIGDACFVGPFVEIQKGVTIGAHSKVQSHSFICELVSIGEQDKRLVDWPELIFIEHSGVFVSPNFSLAKALQLRCYYDVISRVAPDAYLETLDDLEIHELLNWDAEKLRQQMARW